MTTAVYLRKSRAEEQNDTQEETLQNHRKILLEYARRQELHIVKIYEEVVSGESLFARPQMLRLLEAVENGEYQAVLCMDIDRLGRGGMRDQGVILDAFKYSGTKIITPDKTYDLNNELDEELTEFKTFLSRRELKIINKRLRRGLNRTAEDGGYLANAPYGYQKDIAEKKPTLKIVESEAFFVRLMFEWYLSGLGASAIAGRLNKMGAVPRRSGQFSRGAVSLILQNPVYCGKIVWNRTRRTKDKNGPKVLRTAQEEWIVAEGLHSPIISQKQFDAAQAIRQSRCIPPAQAGKTLKNPLAGIIRCANCGSPMQRMQTKGREYLLCPSPGCCAASSLPLVEQALIRAAAPFLNSLALPPISAIPDPCPFNLAAKQALTREEASLHKQKETLYNLLEQGVYDPCTFRIRLDKLEQKQQALLHQKELFQKAPFPAPPMPDNIPHAAALLQFASPAQRNRIYRILFPEVQYRRRQNDKGFTLAVRMLDF